MLWLGPQGKGGWGGGQRFSGKACFRVQEGDVPSLLSKSATCPAPCCISTAGQGPADMMTNRSTSSMQSGMHPGMMMGPGMMGPGMMGPGMAGQMPPGMMPPGPGMMAGGMHTNRSIGSMMSGMSPSARRPIMMPSARMMPPGMMHPGMMSGRMHPGMMSGRLPPGMHPGMMPSARMGPGMMSAHSSFSLSRQSSMQIPPGVASAMASARSGPSDHASMPGSVRSAIPGSARRLPDSGLLAPGAMNGAMSARYGPQGQMLNPGFPGPGGVMPSARFPGPGPGGVMPSARFGPGMGMPGTARFGPMGPAPRLNPRDNGIMAAIMGVRVYQGMPPPFPLPTPEVCTGCVVGVCQVFDKDCLGL